MKTPRMSPQTLAVLAQFLEHPSGWHYGYELSRQTGLKSGTLYPILMRLAKCGMLETGWSKTEKGVPPRHTYRLTAKGVSACSKDAGRRAATGRVIGLANAEGGT